MTTCSPTSPSSSNPPKKAQPITWAYNETLLLLHLYRQTWYSLNRASLKAPHWDHISATLSSAKTPTQCRHKVDKLRKRHRAEKLKSQPSTWPFFPIMEALERGPLPLSSAPPITSTSYDNHNTKEDEDDIDLRKRRKMGAQAQAQAQADVMVADEVRGFVERFVMVEKKKMEVIRENERFRMEMENRRLEMILLSNHKTLDLVSRVFGLSKDGSEEVEKEMEKKKKTKMKLDEYVDVDS